MRSSPHTAQTTTIALTLLFTLGIPGCGQTDVGDSPHVLLITLDTARADRFFQGGIGPSLTPRLDTLATEGTVFLEAISPAPITLPAHASILTGLLPINHGVRNNGTYRLSEDFVTLPELLKEHGYHTAAFVGAAVLDSQYGLDQGFDHYDDSMGSKPGAEFEPQVRANEVVERALNWLRSNSRSPTFVWIHLFDPHNPYDPPEPERSRFAKSLYDGEIAYSDRMIGRLLDGYREEGLYDESIIVFTSDHGEALGDHGELTHGAFLFDETVRVPLVVRAPGWHLGERVITQVQLIDLLPTVGSLLRLELPDDLDGRPLISVNNGENALPRAAYLETLLPIQNHGWFELRGVRTDSLKIIHGPRTRLYDLDLDPAELRDIFEAKPESGREMLQILRDQFLSLDRASSNEIGMDDETRDKLTSLGYVSMDHRSLRKEMGVSTYSELRAELVRELFGRGLRETAIRNCVALLPTEPATDGCIAELETLGAGPSVTSESVEGSHPELLGIEQLVAAAGHAAGRGDRKELREKLEILSRFSLVPGTSLDAQNLATAATLGRIGSTCWEHLDYPNALHAYLLASRLLPADAGLHYNLGLTWERLGEVHAALRAFERSLELNPHFLKAEEHRRYMEAVMKWLPLDE